MNWLKALHRGPCIACQGTRFYSARFQTAWLEQLHQPRGAAARRDALQRTRPAAAAALSGAGRHAGTKPPVSRPEMAAEHSFLWAGAGRRVDGSDPIAPPFSGQAAIVALRRPGVVTSSSADYRGVQGQLAPLAQACLGAGVERQSRP